MRGGPNPAGGVPEVFLMLVVVNRILAPSSVEIAGCRIYILQGSKLCSPGRIRPGSDMGGVGFPYGFPSFGCFLLNARKGGEFPTVFSRGSGWGLFEPPYNKPLREPV